MFNKGGKLLVCTSNIAEKNCRQITCYSIVTVSIFTFPFDKGIPIGQSRTPPINAEIAALYPDIASLEDFKV